MLNSFLQNHPVFIPMESLLMILDFRLRILDLWNRYALSIFATPGVSVHTSHQPKKQPVKSNKKVNKCNFIFLTESTRLR
jgi:hypothetical protein